jgi:CspA family cold shock protein
MMTKYHNKATWPATSSAQRTGLTGTIAHWNRERGFGFAQRDDGRSDLFVHINAVAADADELRIGQRISFDVGTDPKSGKTRAIDVRLID